MANIVAIIINLNTGFTKIHFNDFFANSENSTIAKLRINRCILMIFIGISTAISGFIIQEYFQNPLASPSILGINSTAGMGAALCIFMFDFFTSHYFFTQGVIASFAIMCSILMMLFILFIGQFLNEYFLIIFGLLISSFINSIISIFQFYSDNQNLKNYILWSFGANNQTNTEQTMMLSIFIIIGLVFSMFTIKPLIGWSFGENYAKSIGVNIKNLKYLVILSSSLLSASITSFIGPILFIELLVPHFCRLIYSPSHLWKQWILNILVGIFISEVISIISEISLLPFNIISSIVGIPIIISMILKNKNLAK